MDAALPQPLSELDTQPVGQLISRVTNDTEVIRDLYVTVVFTVLRSAALVGAMLVAMFSLGWGWRWWLSLLFSRRLLIDDDYSSAGQHANRSERSAPGWRISTMVLMK